MRRLPYLIACAVMAWAAAPAEAGPDWSTPGAIERFGGAYVSPDPMLSDADRGRLTARRYAVCVVKNRNRDVNQYFSIPADSEASSAALSRLATDRCMMDGRLEMPHMLFRGALFRAAFLQDNAGFPGPAPEAPSLAPFVSPTVTDKTAYYIATMQFADCLVRKNPKDSVEFLNSYPGSGPERAAFERLAPEFSGCLSAGSQIALNKSMIEALLSEAIYREAEAAKAAGLAEAKK